MSSSFGLATRIARHLAREMATFSRLCEKRNVIRPEIRLNMSKMSHLGGVDQEGSIPMKNDDQLIGNLIDLIKEARRKQGFDVH
jgi:hypothetical protein